MTVIPIVRYYRVQLIINTTNDNCKLYCRNLQIYITDQD